MVPVIWRFHCIYWYTLYINQAHCFPQNHPVERIWVEINSRVNYPVKACLNKMMENDSFNLDSDTHKFCISWFSIGVCCVGTKLTVLAWNDHPTPGIYIQLTRVWLIQGA